MAFSAASAKMGVEECSEAQLALQTGVITMAKAAGKARKKLPKELAVVRADNCTGCKACIEVCPVDCIYKVPGEHCLVCKALLILTSSMHWLLFMRTLVSVGRH